MSSGVGFDDEMRSMPGRFDVFPWIVVGMSRGVVLFNCFRGSSCRKSSGRRCLDVGISRRTAGGTFESGEASVGVLSTPIPQVQ